MPIQVLLALLLAFCLSCPVRASHPALFRAAKGESTAYVFGTVHLLSHDASWFSGPVKEAFDASNVVVMECDAERLQLLGLWEAFRLMREWRRKDLPIVGRRLGPHERAAYYKVLEQVKLEPRQLDLNASVYAWLTLGLKAAELGKASHGRGCEIILSSAARTARKDLKFLESQRDQFQVLQLIPEEEGVLLLGDLVRDWEHQRSGKTEADWRSGDLAAIASNAAERMRLPVFSRVMLDQRNARWAEWLNRRATKGESLFMAVGAAHLDGPQGLLALLSQRGWQVDRMIGSTAALPGNSQAK